MCQSNKEYIMQFYKKITKKRSLAILFIMIVIFGGSFAYYVPNAQAALLTTSSVQFSNSLPSATGVTFDSTITNGTGTQALTITDSAANAW